MEYYHALSLDGGGIRGVLTTTILDRLDSIFPFLEKVDLFAGTSTGGVLALGLAAGYTPLQLRELYIEHAAEVFQDSLRDDVADLGMLIGAEYENRPFIKLLKDRFGDVTLDELPKRVLITTFDLDNQASSPRHRTWKPKFFHNFPGYDSDGHEKVVDVAVRTSAAPSYFPVYQGYIDGGVVANNPSMCALSQCVHPAFGKQPLDQVVLLSLGTGINLKYLEAQDEDWGLAQWARHLVSLMLEGSAGTVHHQCRMMLGKRYRRVNPLLTEPIGLDEYQKVPEMIRIGETEPLRQELRWLRTYF
jgi:patatin-like phospholipase/acyl hydrolase